MMDVYKNIERVKALLMQECGCTLQEAIEVCDKAKSLFERQLTQQLELEKYNQQLKDIQTRENREMRRTKGYKVVRFKKPIRPEDRRVYQRVCRRCDSLYRTTSKYSWFCDKCKINGQSNQVHEKNKYHQKGKN